ncbi:hypothetical protein BU14_0093s0003 [Porphyra umbilicalis]|uniref:PBP domain-containing protein n=1 Tax=Porphyra umbilicalis TaxID=2786 RepID=A0A1X6PDV1_PORUM|nr:hypothetical protein BU14_0093s0003 [Porphyra umbilicalis]|eukprot:OSX78960.1 hypothetical protein BU14_0093s0003 [Porphyra umbilicalis]
MAKATLIASVASVAVLAAAAAAAPAAALVTLNAAGASFPQAIYTKWFAAASGWNTVVKYAAVGSGAGIKRFAAGTVDFGATDSTLDNKEVAAIPRGVVQIPMVGGAVAVVYNKRGCNLSLSQAQLVQIFLGKLNNWKAVGCAAAPIRVVYRADASGTTASFTTSLLAFSKAWARVGAGKTVKWPVGVGKKGSSGVANFVGATPNTISYVSFGAAQAKGLQIAALANAAGKRVKPTAVTMVAGLSKIPLDGANRGTDPNPKGASSYPIVSYTWVLAYARGNKKLAALRTTLLYMLSPKAQGQANGLGFVRLPAPVRMRSLRAVRSLKA